jgi:glycogen(starch) synthase
MTTGELGFSVIVNTTDRAGPLQTLLKALNLQSYPHFEVIVVVGPTQDNTLEILSDYEGRVRVLRCPKANLSQSRNIGLLAAQGDVVVYIDDDAVPCARWLEQLARLFSDPDLDATGGAVYLVHPNRPTVQHRIGIVSSLSEQVDVRSSWLEHIVPEGKGCHWIARMMGTNMAFRRQALLEVGGFDEFYVYIAEETDVMLRLVRAGKIVHPVKEATVYHVPASSRHRVPFSYVGKWWLQTRSGVYYCIKNGPPAGDSLHAITLRCLKLVHGHWLWYKRLLKEHKITLAQFLAMCFGEIRGFSSGVFGGLFLSRQLINASLQPE